MSPAEVAAPAMVFVKSAASSFMRAEVITVSGAAAVKATGAGIVGAARAEPASKASEKSRQATWRGDVFIGQAWECVCGCGR